MRRKAHTALTAPLVLHRTRIEKKLLNNSIGQWRNKLFVIVFNRFSLVKASMNAPRICKLRKTVSPPLTSAQLLKTPQFLHFFSKNIPSVQQIFSAAS
jgi:hypothetical protein